MADERYRRTDDGMEDRERGDYDRRPERRRDYRGDYGDYGERNRGANILAWVLGILLLLLLAGFLWWYFARDNFNDTLNISQNQQTEQNQNVNFRDDVKTASFNNSVPSHAQTIPAAPANVVIATNTTLNNQSTITIEKDGQDFGQGAVRLEADSRVIRRDVAKDAPNGVYTVNYKTCEQGKTCQEGSYQFNIDRNQTNGYQNLTDNSVVAVAIENGKLNPENIIISNGTRLVWQNKENRPYTLYPGSSGTENYFPNLNSGAIQNGASYSFTVNQEGYFPYYAKNGNILNGNVVVR